MTRHISVLLDETIDALQLHEGMTVVDVTLGGGGHSRVILEKISVTGRLIALDMDAGAVERFREDRQDDARIRVFHANYASLEEVLAEAGVSEVDAIVADLGFSSDQIEAADRGLSFRLEGPLDMRLDPTEERTAQVLVNTLSEDALTKIFREYGDEPRAHAIAKALVKAREEAPITTTTALAEVIERSTPMRFRRNSAIHPATKSFQALRIAVNREFERLNMFLPQAVRSLRMGGHLAIISFHSGEDRIVKHFLREAAGGCICPKNFPLCRCGKKPLIRILTTKPILPSEAELTRNPRARSAKLRVAERVDGEHPKQKTDIYAKKQNSPSGAAGFERG
jgi:16S rRNA (cytosine1402-N4)-methyltransferase